MLISIFLVLLAAVLGNYLILQRFKREKLWKTKYIAYLDFISIIENIGFWAQEIYYDSCMLPLSSFPKNITPEEYFSTAIRKLNYYQSTGKLFFNRKFLNLINEFESKLFRLRMDYLDDKCVTEPSEYSFLLWTLADKTLDLVAEYMPQLLTEAKSQLNF